MTQKQVAVKNIVTYYYDTEKNSPTILYLHGWMSNKEVFQKCASELSKDFRIVALDLPGFGKTSWPKESWSIFEYADFVRNFIDKLELKNIILVGHSMGGRISAIIANDKEISKVVTIGAAGLPYHLSWKRRLVKRSAKLLKKFHAPIPENFKNLFRSNDYKKTSGIQRETFLKIVNQDLTQNIEEIKKPALLIWGEHDTESPIWMAHKWHDLVKNSKLEIIKGQGHFPQLTDSELVVKLIENFAK